MASLLKPPPPPASHELPSPSPFFFNVSRSVVSNGVPLAIFGGFGRLPLLFLIETNQIGPLESLPPDTYFPPPPPFFVVADPPAGDCPLFVGSKIRFCLNPPFRRNPPFLDALI